MNEQEVDSARSRCIAQRLSGAHKTPVNLLNGDTLQYVFVLLAQDPVRSEEDWSWYSIAHVCHRWRKVALDVGAFWSNIICHPVSQSLDMINVQLSHSKATNISLTFKQRGLHIMPSQISEIAKAILVHKGRITNMCLHIYDTLWDDFKVFMDRFPPKLNSLDIQFLHEDEIVFPIMRVISLQDILSLTGLRKLRVVKFDLKAISLDIDNLQPLRSLTEINFDNVEFEWFYLHGMIRLCPNLENLSIVSQYIHRGTHFDSSSFAQLHLPFLRNVKIHKLFTSQAHDLFQGFQVPVNADLDLRCLIPVPLTFLTNDNSPSLLNITVKSLFSRHRHCEMLRVAMTGRTVLFRTESGQEGRQDSGTVTTTSVLFNHIPAGPNHTNNERCAFLIELIRSTYWKKVESFSFSFRSGTGEITKDQWVDLLRSFDNLSSLDLSLPFNHQQYQAEFSAALRHLGDHFIHKTPLKNLFIKLPWYDENLIGDLKYFLHSNSTKISMLKLEYPAESGIVNHVNIQDLSESLSGCAQDVRVEMHRSFTPMFFSE